MEKFYSLLIVTDELRKSPAVSRYGRLHDVLLEVGKEQIVSFTLPMYVTSRHSQDVCVLFNPDLVELADASVSTHPNLVQTLITVRLIGKDVGSTSIGFVTPERASHEIAGARSQYAFQLAYSN